MRPAVMPVPEGVGATALGVCRLRAIETARPDRLFADPLAGPLVEISGWPPGAGGGDAAGDGTVDGDGSAGERAALAAWISVRTRFLDDLLTEATGSGSPLVLLGAGLDTRAFRLAWPSTTRCFELDTTAVLAFKEGALRVLGARPACRRVVVPADLRDNWPGLLARAGWDAGRPTAWVAEGLLVYLTDDARDRLVEQVSERSPAGSRLGLTVDARTGETGRSGLGFRSLYRSTAWVDPVGVLEGLGRRAEAFDPRERFAAYGRPGPVRPGPRHRRPCRSAPGNRSERQERSAADSGRPRTGPRLGLPWPTSPPLRGTPTLRPARRGPASRCRRPTRAARACAPPWWSSGWRS